MIFKFGENIRSLFRNLKWVDRLVSSLEKKEFNRIVNAEKKRFSADSTFVENNQDKIDELRNNGVIFLPSYFNFEPGEIEDFRNMMHSEGKEFDSVQTFYPDLIPLSLKKLCEDKYIENIIDHSRGYKSPKKVLRLYHSSHIAEETGSFLWHHDGLFDYYKVLVYLTEVNMENGPLGYCLGSNNNDWKYYSYERSRFEEAEIKQYQTKYFLGKPGDLIILNANGIHKAMNPLLNFDRLVASLAFIDFNSNQSTDHLYASENKLSYLRN
jgi:hypothetical protein